MIGEGKFLYIPGFLTWVAFSYAFFVSWVTLKVEKPLIGLDYKQKSLEGNLRFAFGTSKFLLSRTKSYGINTVEKNLKMRNGQDLATG